MFLTHFILECYASVEHIGYTCLITIFEESLQNYTEFIGQYIDIRIFIISVMASASKTKYQSGSSYLHGLRKIKVIVVCSRAA